MRYFVCHCSLSVSYIKDYDDDDDDDDIRPTDRCMKEVESIYWVCS